MRKPIWICAAVLAAAVPTTARAQTQEPRLVTMTGYGTVQSTPDRAWVTVGVEKRDPATKVAQEQTAIAMDRVVQRVKSLGIPENAIRTSSFNVAQDWEFQPGSGRRTLRGYVVSNQVEIKVDDITKVGTVIDGAIEAGANIIHGMRWDLKNRDSLEQQALRSAFNDARRRADVIATASGSRIVRVYAVQESRAGQVRPTMAMRSTVGQAGFAAANESIIQPGELEIRAVVTVSFVIEG